MTRKLIDAEAAKAAIEAVGDDWRSFGYTDKWHAADYLMQVIDALPDASEQAQQAGDGAEEI